MPAEARAQPAPDLVSAPGDVLYREACAGCHGVDGRGVDPALLAFEEEVPDFTDCDFAAREPDADWIAVAHEGGPVRGFSEMMPAFRGALSPEQLQRVMNYIRVLCTDKNWPRGELNLPRPFVTQKAYPEDEWVVVSRVALDDPAEVEAEYVYEQRFGPRSQWEVVVPFHWNRSPADPSDAEANQSWRGGLGDIELAAKHAVYHSIESGSILSLAGQVHLPTGDESKGFGAPGADVGAFLLFGQILGSDSFLQTQAGMAVPLYSGGSADARGRLALGRTFSQGEGERSWTPMLEVVANRAVESDAEIRADLVPQVQIALNTRQHVLANLGVLIPASDKEGRSPVFLAYVLLDWFDGGFTEGW